MNSRLPYFLTGYGLPYTMGYIPLRNGISNRHPWTPIELAQAALQLGLEGIEVPLATRIPSFDGQVVDMPSYVDEVFDFTRQHDLKCVLDYGVIATQPVEELVECLRTAHRLGAGIVRAIISDLLCGDRRPIPEGWEVRLERTAGVLRKVAPIAADLGVCIAVENHQDASPDDLWRLYDAAGGGDALGVTLDAGNPLANGEDPVVACERIAPIVRHVHLKDYRVFLAPNGYRLVRCAAGKGVVDFPRIIAILRKQSPHIQFGIEQAAQAARTIPLLDANWWATYPPRSATSLLPLLSLIWQKGLPSTEDYRTAWESDEDESVVRQDEWKTLLQSVDYFARYEASLRDASMF